MTAFPDIVVDPYLVCIPRDCHSVEKLDSFVEQLLGWAELLQRNDINLTFPASCLDALIEENQYPYGHNLKRLAAQFGAEHLSADFVSRVAQGVLERTPTLEERCHIHIVIFDEETYKIQPDVFVTRLGPKIGWGLKHALSVVACCLRKNTEPKEFILASAKSNPEENFESEEVRISTYVQEVDSATDNDWWRGVLPIGIDQALSVAFSRSSLLSRLGCLRLWGNAESEADARDAISVKVDELMAIGAGVEADIKAFRLGERFLESARRNAFGARTDLASNLIESCARILVGIPKNPIEPFREDAAATAAQLERSDGALAWRTHLTKHGVGFRLMFWGLSDGTIEFANVGPKAELEIF